MSAFSEVWGISWDTFTTSHHGPRQSSKEQLQPSRYLQHLPPAALWVRAPAKLYKVEQVFGPGYQALPPSRIYATSPGFAGTTLSQQVEAATNWLISRDHASPPLPMHDHCDPGGNRGVPQDILRTCTRTPRQSCHKDSCPWCWNGSSAIWASSTSSQSHGHRQGTETFFVIACYEAHRS